MLNERKLSKDGQGKLKQVVGTIAGDTKRRRKLVKKHNKAAGRIVQGIAVKAAQKYEEKQAETMDQDKIKEAVKSALMGPVSEKQASTDKYDDNPALKGKQSELPDGLQKAIIKKAGGKLEEGFYGSSYFENVINALGYDGIDDFFEDNPGAVSAMMDWVESIPEFSEMLKDADLMETKIDLTPATELVSQDGFVFSQFKGMAGPALSISAPGMGDNVGSGFIQIPGFKLDSFTSGLKDAIKAFKSMNEGILDEVKKLTKDNFVQMVRDEMMAGSASDEYVSDERVRDKAKYLYRQYLKGASVEDLFKENVNEGDLDLGHQDNEPHMLKADLYRIGKYAMELYQMVDGFEGQGEVDFPHWWQSKIIKSKDALVGAKHYLDFELKEPQIDAMVDVAQEEEVIDESDARDKAAAEFDGKEVGDIINTSKGDFKKVDDKHFEMVGKPGRKFTAKQMTFIKEESIQRPSQEEVDAFFQSTGDESHYLANKPVEKWDKYDNSNWKAKTSKRQPTFEGIAEKLAKQLKSR